MGLKGKQSFLDELLRDKSHRTDKGSGEKGSNAMIDEKV